MPENDSYALWIVPEWDAYTITDGYIARLSRAYGLPRFAPHVTVLGGIRSPESAELRALAESLAPFTVRLAHRVEFLDEYFRCLFLPAQQTPELMQTFSKASQLFGRQGNGYFPHLSLAYGDLPVETKREMIAALGEIPEIAFEAQEISLVHASKSRPVSDWKVIQRFPFT